MQFRGIVIQTKMRLFNVLIEKNQYDQDFNAAGLSFRLRRMLYHLLHAIF